MNLTDLYNSDSLHTSDSCVGDVYLVSDVDGPVEVIAAGKSCFKMQNPMKEIPVDLTLAKL